MAETSDNHIFSQWQPFNSFPFFFFQFLTCLAIQRTFLTINYVVCLNPPIKCSLNTPSVFLVYCSLDLWQNNVFVISFSSLIDNTAHEQFLLFYVSTSPYSLEKLLFFLSPASFFSIFNLFFHCLRLHSSLPRAAEQVQYSCGIGVNNSPRFWHIVIFWFSWSAFSELTIIRSTPFSYHLVSSLLSNDGKGERCRRETRVFQSNVLFKGGEKWVGQGETRNAEFV